MSELVDIPLDERYALQNTSLLPRRSYNTQPDQTLPTHADKSLEAYWDTRAWIELVGTTEPTSGHRPIAAQVLALDYNEAKEIVETYVLNAEASPRSSMLYYEYVPCRSSLPWVSPKGLIRVPLQVVDAQETVGSQPTRESDEPDKRETKDALRNILDWTRLPVERVRALIGTSRSSFYHWLRGGTPSEKFEARILRLVTLLESVHVTREPSEVREWLETGSPSPMELIGDERWEEAFALVTSNTLRVKWLKPGEEEQTLIEDEGQYSEARAAVLRSFALPAEIEVPAESRRTVMEYTGLEDYET